MFSTGDTIVAVATPPGRGSIGVVRLSGAAARGIGEQLVHQALEPRRAVLGRLGDASPDSIPDRVVATWFVAPHSYTGEDVVEISTHGNPVILDQLVAASARLGARHAMPGEFTFRAYLNDRIDLVQAEAVADLVEAMTPLQARAACDQLDGTLSGVITGVEARLFSTVARLEASLDFPDEGFHFIEPDVVARELESVAADLRALLTRAEAGRVLREGLRVVIVGRPNVGKSSLFNALAGTSRAIVTVHPGTTRDVLTAPVEVFGIPCEVVDTAGVRHSDDEIEVEGMARGAQAASTADVTVVVLDGSTSLDPEDLALVQAHSGRPCLVVLNKADLGVRDDVVAGVADDGGRRVVCASALSRTGLDEVRRGVAAAIIGDDSETNETPRVTNRRHAAMLSRAVDDVTRGAMAARSGASEEFVLSDLHAALSALQSVTGKRTPDAVLSEIFSRFCVGK